MGLTGVGAALEGVIAALEGAAMGLTGRGDGAAALFSAPAKQKKAKIMLFCILGLLFQVFCV